MYMPRSLVWFFTASVALVSACGGGRQIGEPPPADADEPVYAASQNHELYFDGFESFNSTNQLLTYGSVYANRYANSGAAGISLTTNGAVAGQKAARFTYSSSSSQENELLEVVSTDGGNPSVVVLTFWLRAKPGYVWWSGVGTGGQGHKIFVANISGAPQGNRLLLEWDHSGIEPSELNACFPDLAYEATPTWSIGSALYKQNMALTSWSVLTNANDGGWHRYTTRFQKSTVRPTTARGNGRIEMWVDGRKIMEYLGDDPARCEYGLVTVPTVELIPDLHFPSVDGAVAASQWIEFDDIRVWTP